jgi:hypothetical protein
MTGHDGVINDMNPDPMTTSSAKLREEVLTDGLAFEVDLSSVDSRVLQQYPNAPLAERQSIVLDTVRWMVDEGLFHVGDLRGEGGQFVAFDEPLDDSMAAIQDAYLVHHDEGLKWVFVFWFDLTDKGRRLATSTEHGRQIAEQVAEDFQRVQEFMRAAERPDTDD